MKLYTHLRLSHARTIINLANKGISRYKISKITGISKGKIKRCLEGCKKQFKRINMKQPWKDAIISTSYSWKNYRDYRDQSKLNRAFKYANHAEIIYLDFIKFCKNLYNNKILGREVKRSADEFIKEFRKFFPDKDFPKRYWVYKMARSPHYQFESKWLPSNKKESFSLKSDDERKKPEKYMSIENRPNKELLRSVPNNYEIDSVIGKRTDKQALLTLIDIHTGDFYSAFYKRDMLSFKNAFKNIIETNNLTIETLTMDNGGENNLLHEILPREIMYNCHPYSSGEKGTLENKHRILRRVIPKGISLDNYSKSDLPILNSFINNYYSKTFNRI